MTQNQVLKHMTDHQYNNFTVWRAQINTESSSVHVTMLQCLTGEKVHPLEPLFGMGVAPQFSPKYIKSLVFVQPDLIYIKTQ